MIRKLSERIVDKQIDQNVLSASDRSIYIYGYQTMIELSIIIVLAAVITIISGEILIIVGFCVAFIPLRIYSGGWHAKSIFVCAIVSGVVIYGVTIAYRYLEMIDAIYGLTLEAILCIAMAVLSPAETKEKPLSQNEMKRYQKYVINTLLVELTVSIIDAMYFGRVLYALIIYVVCVQGINIMLSYLTNSINTIKRIYTAK